MNRIILLVLFVFSYCVGTSQSISQRSQPVITVQDGRLFAQYNFRPPVFADTIQANLQIGLDSCGALIFSRDINSYYLRACSPKRWVAVSSGGTTIDTTSLSNRINLKIDSLKRISDSVFAYKNGTRVFQFRDSVGGGTPIDTTNQFVKRLTRTPGVDSIIYFVGANRFAIKDSVGGSGVFDTVYTQSPIMSRTSGDSNIIFFNADTANVWRGGGGGVGGSGTQYFVPKWSASTTLQNSQIFDSVNVGINTTTPAYKLDVKGTTRIKAERSGELFLIEDSLGNDRIKVSNDSTFITGGTIPLTIIGSGGVQAKIGNANFETPQRIFRHNGGVLEFYGGNNDGNGFDFNYNNQPQSTSTNSAMINLGGIYKNQQSFAFSNLLISPTYNFDSTNVTSSAIARGIYYNPTIPLNGLRSAKHIAFQSNSGNVVMKGLKTSSSTTDSIAIWINDTLSKAPYPSGGGGGGTLVNYYLNGSVNQGTIGGIAYREVNKVPIIGAGTDFTINADGYIQSFITDANDPSQLFIPAGNWNFEMWFSASSGGGAPKFYVELYKWDGATLSLIATSSATPEGITNGTSIDLYTTALAVPATVLTLTDRLVIRVFVIHSGRTITLYTEDSHLCEIITTFQSGIASLNGLTAQDQTMVTGTDSTDFKIVSTGTSHTFNLPTASATNTGKLSSANWTTFNNKLNPSDTISLSNRIDNKQTGLDILNLMGYGIKAEPFGLTLSQVSTQLATTSQQLALYPFYWNKSDSVRGVAWFNRATTVIVPNANYNGVAIYSLNGGTLTRETFTANSGTFWDATANIWKTQPITPKFLPKGLYFFGYQVSGTGTLPTIAAGEPLVVGAGTAFATPPTEVNSNGVRFSSFILNPNTTPFSTIAMSGTTGRVGIPYFLFY